MMQWFKEVISSLLLAGTGQFYQGRNTMGWIQLGLQLTACGKSESKPTEGDAAPPPQQVQVMALQPRDLPVSFEYVGRLEASREVEIRPRITGLIEERLFDEGSQVIVGQTLFRLDAAPFVARKRVAEAAMAEARSSRTWKTSRPPWKTSTRSSNTR